MNIYKLTLLALLAALAVGGRIIFTYLPNVQPVTSLIIICGLFLGPVAAVLLAVLTTFLSNMILGMGIWAIWQIISWSLIGVISGFIGKIPRRIPMVLIILFSVFSGYLYGFIISLTNYQIAGGNFWAYYMFGLPYDTNHAIGNAVFMIFLYPSFTYFLKKYANNRFSLQNTN